MEAEGIVDSGDKLWVSFSATSISSVSCLVLCSVPRSLGNIVLDRMLGSASILLSLGPKPGDVEDVIVSEGLTVKAGVWLIECLCGAARSRGGVIGGPEEGSRLLGEDLETCSLRVDLRVSV